MVVAAASLPSNARGWHTEEQRLTDDTAYTLPEGRFRLGLWKAQYTPWAPLLIGTHLLPWAVLAPNAHVKLRLVQADPVALALQGGYFRLDSSRVRFLDDGGAEAVVTSIPAELIGSFRIGRPATFSAGGAYTAVKVDGELAQEAFHGAGKAAVDNLQAFGTLELRFSRVTAFVIHGRYLVYQAASGELNYHSRPDEYTTVDVETAADADIRPEHGYWVASTLVLSWEYFNLELGAGYGNVNVPAINLMLERRMVLPTVDVYWIF